MPWQTSVVVQLQAGDTIINPNGTFVYSSAPAAGNLIASIAPAAGTDQFGNHYLFGMGSYGATSAAQLTGSDIDFYTGSLAAGWTLVSQMVADSAGNLSLTAGAELDLFSNTGIVTINGSSSTGGPNSTGFFNTQGLASGSYGSTHQHTLPNFPTATHGHPL